MVPAVFCEATLGTAEQSQDWTESLMAIIVLLAHPALKTELLSSELINFFTVYGSLNMELGLLKMKHPNYGGHSARGISKYDWGSDAASQKWWYLTWMLKNTCQWAK